jgi:predicted nucleic acid-binding Zn ribbon protein
VTPALRAQVLREWQPFVRPEPVARLAMPLGKLVPAVVQGLGLSERLQQSQVFFHWPDIVGKDIATHAHPVSLRNKLLVVAVDHPGWLQELSRYHKPLLLQKVRDRIGKAAVKDIVFRIG